MIPLIKEQHFTPEEVIFDAQDETELNNHDRSIYFVSEGTVEVFMKINENFRGNNRNINNKNESSDNNDFQTIRRLKKGDVFG